MTTRLTDYLTWARHMDAVLHHDPSCANLFASATREPRAMLMADLQMTGLNTLQSQLSEPLAWGHPAILNSLRTHYALTHDQDVILTSSASMAFVVTALGLTRPGDHAIIETPIYQPFVNVLRDRGVRLSRLSRPAPTYQPDPAALEALITPGTRLIVLTNLHNPSGTLLDTSALDAIAAVAARRNITVIVDEVYRDLAPDSPDQVRTAALHAPNVISISSLSKTYGLGRLRVGWIIAAPAMMMQLKAAHVLFDNSLSALDQAVAIEVCADLPRYRAHGQAAAAANHPTIQAFATEMQAAGILEGDVPGYGCTYFPAVSGYTSTDDLVEWLEERYRVVVVPGRFFEAPGHIRISFGGEPAALKTGLERLKAGLQAAAIKSADRQSAGSQ